MECAGEAQAGRGVVEGVFYLEASAGKVPGIVWTPEEGAPTLV